MGPFQKFMIPHYGSPSPTQALQLKLSGYWSITFQRSAEANQRKSLESAESCFTSLELHICSSLKERKKQRGEKK